MYPLQKWLLHGRNAFLGDEILLELELAALKTPLTKNPRSCVILLGAIVVVVVVVVVVVPTAFNTLRALLKLTVEEASTAA